MAIERSSSERFESLLLMVLLIDSSRDAAIIMVHLVVANFLGFAEVVMRGRQLNDRNDLRNAVHGFECS